MKRAMLLIVIISNISYAAERVSSKNLQHLNAIIAKYSASFDKKDILVVFDFDNTLMAMNQDIGSDQWYNWQSKAISENLNKEKMLNSKEELFEVHYKLFALGDMHLVEKNTAELVQKIQSENIKSFIMTSRGSEYRNDIEIELERGGLSFKESAIGPLGGYASRFVPEGTGLTRLISYEDGILMGSGQNKGILLKYILNKTNSQFKLIIFIDDTLKNIENVEAVYSQDPSVITFYYTHEEDRVLKFEKDKKKAWKEWKKLKPVLQFYKEQSLQKTK